MSDQEFSLLDLFREEARAQTATLSQGLVELEADPGNPQKLEPLMRAAHSLKGAARIVGVEGAVGITHALEEALVAAQNGHIRLTAADIDVLLRGCDLLGTLADLGDDRGEPVGARAGPSWPSASPASSAWHGANRPRRARPRAGGRSGAGGRPRAGRDRAGGGARRMPLGPAAARGRSRSPRPLLRRRRPPPRPRRSCA